MKVLSVAACLSLAGCSLFPVASDNTEKDKITVGELLEVIKRAIRDAQAEIGDTRLPPLASLVLTLQTKETAGASASADYLVVSGKVKGERSAAQTISVKLTPPPRDARFLERKDDIYDGVVKAVKAASIAANQAFSANPNDLQLDNVGATLAFDVSRSGEVGLKFDIGLVKVGAGVSYAISSSHKIDLVFQRPKT